MLFTSIDRSTGQEPVADIKRSLSDTVSRRRQMLTDFKEKDYSETRLTTFVELVTSYTDDTMRDGIISMTVPRDWFLYSVPFSAHQVLAVLIFVAIRTLLLRF